MLCSVRRVYLGGGTPSVLRLDLLHQILRSARRICPDTVEEFTVEANPESVSGAFLTVLEQHRVTRLSLGVQSFNQSVQHTLDRTPVDERRVRAIRSRWSGDLSIDLLIDAPGATAADSSHVAGVAAALGAEHVSAYVLTPEPGTPLHRSLEAGRWLPDTDALEQCAVILAQAGFLRYEASNFALPGHECRHNQTYWNAESYLGIGPSAVSTLYGPHAVRLTQPTRAADFQALARPLDTGEVEALDRQELLLEYLFLRLRTAEGIVRSDFQDRFDRDPVEQFARQIERLVTDGMLVVDEYSVRVPGAKLSFVDGAIRGLL